MDPFDAFQMGQTPLSTIMTLPQYKRLGRKINVIQGQTVAHAYLQSPEFHRVLNIPLGIIFANRPVLETGPSLSDLEMNDVFSDLSVSLGQRSFPYLLVYGFVAYRIVDERIDIVDLSNGTIVQIVNDDHESTLHFIWKESIRITGRNMRSTLQDIDESVKFYIYRPPSLRGQLSTNFFQLARSYHALLQLREWRRTIQRRKLEPPMILNRTLPTMKEDEYAQIQDHAMYISGGRPKGMNWMLENSAENGFDMVNPRWSKREKQLMKNVDYRRFFYAARHKKTGDLITGELIDPRPIKIHEMDKVVEDEYTRLTNLTSENLGLHQLVGANLDKQMAMVQLIFRSFIEVFSPMLEVNINAIILSVYGDDLKAIATAPMPTAEERAKAAKIGSKTSSVDSVMLARIVLQPLKELPDFLWQALIQKEVDLRLLFRLALGEDAVQLIDDEIDPGSSTQESAKRDDRMDTRDDRMDTRDDRMDTRDN